MPSGLDALTLTLDSDKLTLIRFSLFVFEIMRPLVYIEAMQTIQNLPIYIVVRLCTNDEASMHFWNTLDLDLDVPVDVLDDFEAEAAAAFSMNPWCNYCMPIQRLREWGFRSPVRTAYQQANPSVVNGSIFQ